MATYALGYYSVAKLHSKMAEHIFTGNPSYLKLMIRNEAPDAVGIITFIDEDDQYLPSKPDLAEIEEELDSGQIFYCRESFESGQVLEEYNSVISILVLARLDLQELVLNKLEQALQERQLEEYEKQVFEFPAAVRRDGELACKYIARKNLEMIVQLPLAKI